MGRRDPSAASNGIVAVPKPNNIHQTIERRLQDCPYFFMFSQIDWQFDQGTLRIWGKVQSFYLKQVLQELFRKIDEVERIVNLVDVASPIGLSSVRAG